MTLNESCVRCEFFRKDWSSCDFTHSTILQEWHMEEAREDFVITTEF